MARNSFAYKGWAVTLVAAVFALAVKEASPKFVLVALLPTLAFWGLDAYYLRQESLFRGLYDAIRKGGPPGLTVEPFSMDTRPFREKKPSWWRILWSISVLSLYGPLVLIIVIVTVLANLLN